MDEIEIVKRDRNEILKSLQNHSMNPVFYCSTQVYKSSIPNELLEKRAILESNRRKCQVYAR
jgi:hypothetical protein